MRARMFLWLAAGVLLSACAGLSGEPRVVSTLPPEVLDRPSATTPEATVIELGVPPSTPDMLNGARIYAANCVDCHGETGLGDGSVALNSPEVEPGNFRDPASARAQTPHDWYSTITNGRLEKLMPPWRNALTEQERWDVALYTYQMHVSEDQRMLGERLYQECAECHGPLGRGDGPEAANIEGDVKDLSDSAAMATLSDESMFRIVTEGFEDIMPSYADRFSADERWAVIAYARTLSMQGARTAQQVVPATEYETGTFNVLGRAELFGAQIVPLGLTARLEAVNGMTGEPVRLGLDPVAVAADGTFGWQDVARAPGDLVFAVIEYEGVPFASEATAPPNGQDFEIGLMLYDQTDPRTALVISAWVTQIHAFEGALEITQVIQVRNLSDTRIALSPDRLEDGTVVALRLSAPDGAQVLPPDEPGLILSADGNSIIDTQPVYPRSSKLVAMRYTLPYSIGETVALPVDIALGGTVRVLVQPLEVRLSADNLPSLGEQTVGAALYNGYGEQLALAAGTTLDFTLSGQPTPAETAAPSPAVQAVEGFVTLDVLLPVLIALLVILGGVAAWLILRRRR